MKYKNKHTLFLLFIMIITPILTGYAALWQWQRSQYHQYLLKSKQLNQANFQTPIHLNTTRLPNKIDQIIAVSGQWVPNSTVYISPRLINGVRGALIISVFSYINFQKQTQYIAVNRGWTAQHVAQLPPVLPPLSTNLVHLKGQWIETIPRVFELNSLPIKQLGIWQNYNWLTHAQLTHTHLSPYILKLSKDSPDINAIESIKLIRDSLTAEIDILSNKAAKNKGYMIQWLGLCLISCIGLLYLCTPYFKYVVQYLLKKY